MPLSADPLMTFFDDWTYSSSAQLSMLPTLSSHSPSATFPLSSNGGAFVSIKHFDVYSPSGLHKINPCMDGTSYNLPLTDLAPSFKYETSLDPNVELTNSLLDFDAFMA